MTTHHHHDQHDPWDEPEWQEQERAMRDIRRDGADPLGSTVATGYHLIAQALRQPPAASLPKDFAQQMAHSVRTVTHAPRNNAYPERYLLYALGAVLVLSCASTLVSYGDSLRHLFESAMGRWLLVLAICALFAHVMEQWRRQFHHRHAS